MVSTLVFGACEQPYLAMLEQLEQTHPDILARVTADVDRAVGPDHIDAIVAITTCLFSQALGTAVAQGDGAAGAMLGEEFMARVWPRACQMAVALIAASEAHDGGQVLSGVSKLQTAIAEGDKATIEQVLAEGKAAGERMNLMAQLAQLRTDEIPQA